MQPLLEHAMKQIDRGSAAKAAGEPDRARRYYLEAAQALFEAASLSTGDLKEQRTQMAERLMAQARSLEQVAERRRAAAKPASGKAKALPMETVGEESTFIPVEKPGVRFSDVADLEEAKEQIRLKLIYPFTHPEKAEKFGVQKGGGILLYGPPGTGKTLLARAVAGEVDAVFFTVKPSEVMSKWVGEAEQNVQKLFDAAHSYDRAVIFIDELEALVPKRRSSLSSVMVRVVPQVLAELDGFEKTQGALLFIGATNEPWALDPAVLRPGRFDERIYVSLPDLETRRRILDINLRDRPLAPDVDFDILASELEGHSGADIANICRKACAIPFVEAVERGVDREVSMADLREVMAEVLPSVTGKELERYAKYSRGE